MTQRQESQMRTHRFGRKLKLPATFVIKHQIRRLMAKDARKKGGAEAMETLAERPGQAGALEKVA
jgi:hypothetical protein